MAIFNKDSKAADDRSQNGPATSNALSIIAAGTKIVGDIETDGVVKIEGRVEGTIHAARQVLIGRQGEVLGDIDTREAVIGGRVQGTVNATDRTEIQGTSVIIGDINTRALAVVEGGRINGSVRIADAKEPDSDEQSHPSPVAVVR
jgi:cytoskeletal protein CcmA (bactofilin family)